jgi:hypothetical protein
LDGLIIDGNHLPFDRGEDVDEFGVNLQFPRLFSLFNAAADLRQVDFGGLAEQLMGEVIDAHPGHILLFRDRPAVTLVVKISLGYAKLRIQQEGSPGWFRPRISRLDGCVQRHPKENQQQQKSDNENVFRSLESENFYA